MIARGCYGIVYEAHLPIEPKIVIVKIYLTDNMCKDEAASVEKLSEYSSVPMPKIYAIIIKDCSHKHDALVMQKLNGITLNNLQNVSVNNREIISKNVIDALLDINKIKGDYYGEIIGEKQYDSWEEYYNTIINTVLIGLEKRVKQHKYPVELYTQLVQISKDFHRLVKIEVIQPYLMHGDFKPKNVLIDGLAVSGIIDPCGACYGDLAFEARQLTKNNGKDFNLLEGFKNRTNNNSDIFEKRRLFYIIFSDIFHMLKSGNFFIDSTAITIKCYECIQID